MFKILKIEPEGYPIKVAKSALLCASGRKFIQFIYKFYRTEFLFHFKIPGSLTLNNITWDFKVPNKVITKTASTKIVLNGDILGPTITVIFELNIVKLLTLFFVELR